MLNLSIMPLDREHIDYFASDIIEQQKSGASTHAMFMMTFNPEGTPAVDKATAQCKIYDEYRERLDMVGAKHGVLVQSTMGHITIPSSPYPFQPSVSLITGEPRVVTCCPMDPSFREYIRGQFRILAEHKPSLVMIDDDIGLIYKPTKGCACKYHMEELNRRAKKPVSREELYLHTQGTSEEDKYYTDLYIEVQRDGLIGCVAAMRQGLDDVDPTIQGIVSGSYTTYNEFSDDKAVAFAGEGNPRIMRLNGGPYFSSIKYGGSRFFTVNMYRSAMLRELCREKVDIFLAETDTCPHNRYSTSASLLHSHYTGNILEGAEGAKHWITRLGIFEPNAGKAYRRILSKYCGFYEALAKYAKDLMPFGCRIPLTRHQDYGFVPAASQNQVSPWSSSVLERLGLPFFYSNKSCGSLFLDGFSLDGFSDTEVKDFLSGNLILSSDAAEKLCKRGFDELLGVRIKDWQGEPISGEVVYENKLPPQYGVKEITVTDGKTRVLSSVVHTDAATGESKHLFPGVTLYENSLGGRVAVFSGTPDMPFTYFNAFSMLSETRKRQLIEILTESGDLPLYYPDDAEVYLRAGYLHSGEIMAALFNLSQDGFDQIPLYIKGEVSGIQYLSETGERACADFTTDGGKTNIKLSLPAMTPAILFITLKG